MQAGGIGRTYQERKEYETNRCADHDCAKRGNIPRHGLVCARPSQPEGTDDEQRGPDSCCIQALFWWRKATPLLDQDLVFIPLRPTGGNGPNCCPNAHTKEDKSVLVDGKSVMSDENDRKCLEY